MKTLTKNKPFTPVQVGAMELKHRVVKAPLTRSRSVQPGNTPGDLMLEYYSQRASDGGLIVSVEQQRNGSFSDPLCPQL